MNAFFPLFFSILFAVVFFMIERIFPATTLPTVKGWWRRAILANLSQFLIIFIVGGIWNACIRGNAGFHMAKYSDAFAIAATYVLSTFIFYWWHRIRHESTFWWRFVHQIHHSASRLEILTTFYKHPLEIGIDSILGAILVYPIMGCSITQGAIYTLLVAVGEMFYHWNIHTYRWIGVFFQRPESHRIHHQRERHTKNYSELPVWDMLFGTYSNPKNADKVQCGFEGQREELMPEMLRGEPVDTKRRSEPLDLRPACFGCRKRHLCGQHQRAGS